MSDCKGDYLVTADVLVNGEPIGRCQITAIGAPPSVGNIHHMVQLNLHEFNLVQGDKVELRDIRIARVENGELVQPSPESPARFDDFALRDTFDRAENESGKSWSLDGNSAYKRAPGT